MSTLAEVLVGQCGQVTGIAGTDEVSMRLLEMGLTPGTRFSMLGVAPLGDPIEIEVRGYRLSLRKSEAARVSVATQD